MQHFEKNSDSRTALIDYLSNQLATSGTNQVKFRARFLSTIFIGPFLVFGSILVATDGKLDFNPQNISTIIGILGLLASWGFLGYLSARLERAYCDSCESFRKMIFKLSTEDSPKLEESEFLFPGQENLEKGYIAAYICLLIGFSSTVLVGYSLVP